jgi:hypothetical protein
MPQRRQKSAITATQNGVKTTNLSTATPITYAISPRKLKKQIEQSPPNARPTQQ